MKTKFYNIPEKADRNQARREALAYYMAMQPALLERPLSEFKDLKISLVPPRMAPGPQRPYVLLQFTEEEAISLYLNVEGQIEYMYFILTTKARKGGTVAFFTDMRLKWAREFAAKVLTAPELQETGLLAACVAFEALALQDDRVPERVSVPKEPKVSVK
jgi:hypothetical protein